MLYIDNLNKLKITSVKYNGNIIHFKYKDEFYFIQINSSETLVTRLYQGRCRGNCKCIKSEFGANLFLITYNHNKKTLSNINKLNFLSGLYELGLIDIPNEFKTADQMFLELGYKRRYGTENLIVYEKQLEFKLRKEPIRKVIGFDLIKKEIYVFENYIGVEYNLFGNIDMLELEAISKKVKELNGRKYKNINC